MLFRSRGSSGGSGTPQEITVGTGLSMSGTTLSATAGTLQQVFRGLHLRTHPDNDSRKSKVMLVHADAIVTDNNTVVTSSLDRLVADVTVSGAGGLDTGSEGASRWYEIYFIRKSSDGTTNLLLHRAKDYLLDQSFTTVDSNTSLRYSTGAPTDKIAQSFQPGTSGPVSFIDVLLLRAGSVSGNIWWTIEADSGGSPSGTPLATSDKLDASVVSTANQWVRQVFRNPATLTASTTYWLVMQGDYSRSDTVYLAWAGKIAGGYAGGSPKIMNSSNVWSAAPLGDYAFKTYVTQNDTAVTMPTGYTEKALIGYVRNDSGSDFRSFIQLDRRVRYQYQTIVTGFTTSALQTLQDMSSFIPPVPVRAGDWLTRQSVAGNEIDVAAILGSGSATHVFGFYSQCKTANDYDTVGSFAALDYQHLYIYINSGSAELYIGGFEW